MSALYMQERWQNLIKAVSGQILVMSMIVPIEMTLVGSVIDDSAVCWKAKSPNSII